MSSNIWNDIATKRSYDDPFYLDKLKKYMTNDSIIIDYGCGYGRLVNMLNENGYTNVMGFDTSEQMISRGLSENPILNIKLIEHAKIPVNDNSIDVVIMSTIICCVSSDNKRNDIMKEIIRILKPNGIMYIVDFLTTNNEYYLSKYEEWANELGYGIFKNCDAAIIKHSTNDEINKLTHNFKKEWFEEQKYMSPNGYSINSFHGIYRLTIDKLV